MCTGLLLPSNVFEVDSALGEPGGKHAPYLTYLDFLAVQVDGLHLQVYTCTTDGQMCAQTDKQRLLHYQSTADTECADCGWCKYMDTLTHSPIVDNYESGIEGVVSVHLDRQTVQRPFLDLGLKSS